MPFGQSREEKKQDETSEKQEKKTKIPESVPAFFIRFNMVTDHQEVLSQEECMV
jgi:hypothetical protein